MVTLIGIGELAYFSSMTFAMPCTDGSRKLATWALGEVKIQVANEGLYMHLSSLILPNLISKLGLLSVGRPNLMKHDF